LDLTPSPSPTGGGSKRRREAAIILYCCRAKFFLSHRTGMFQSLVGALKYKKGRYWGWGWGGWQIKNSPPAPLFERKRGGSGVRCSVFVVRCLV